MKNPPAMRTGRYEPGAFDIRDDPPRPTAVAELLRELAAGREPSHPAVGTPGWWRRPERLLFPVTRSPARPVALGQV